MGELLGFLEAKGWGSLVDIFWVENCSRLVQDPNWLSSGPTLVHQSRQYHTMDMH